MIRTQGLTKRYGRFAAVDRIGLELQSGEIYGFLGPNGAGKTTTINMLLGTIRPTAGSMELFGEEYSSRRLDLRARIGVVPEHHPQGAWRWMTARDYLGFFAELYAVRKAERRIAELLERVELSSAAKKRVSAFSRGMLQKLSFARALLHDPELLLLDEPISGLDPLGIKQVRDLILEQHRAGRTVLISSHQLSEMERLCTRVGIISRGTLVAQGTIASLFAELRDEVEIQVELESVSPELVRAAAELPFVRSVTAEGAALIVRVGKGRDYRKDIGAFLLRRGEPPLGIRERTPSLEEAFVTITQDTVETLTASRAAAGGTP